MKKIYNLTNLVFVSITLIVMACFFKFGYTWLNVLSTLLIIGIAVANLIYGIIFKSRKRYIFAVPIAASIVIAFIANIFVVKNPTTFFILLIISQILLIVALVTNAKVSVFNLVYAATIAIPILILVNSSYLFGYCNISRRLIVNTALLLMSIEFGLGIAQLIKKQNPFNIVFTATLFVNLVYGLGVVLTKQSNITHKVAPIVTLSLYIVLFMLSITLMFVNEDNIQTLTIKAKTNVISAISVLLVTLIICISLISNFVGFNLASPKIYKQQFLRQVGNELNIPIVEIYTQNNQEPYSKKEYVNCSFKISNCEVEDYNFSVPMTKKYDEEGCVGIRLRGNSTKNLPKRPYRIKFDEKKSLFGLKSNKSWVLLAEYYDQSYIRNYAAFTLADEFDNMDFVATPHHVALMMNGEFKGLYLLCEQMDEKKGRANVDDDFDINVDTEFPFLVEMDYKAYREGVTGVDNFSVPSVGNHAEIKFPEADERGATKHKDPVYDYIYEYINAVFTIMKTGEKITVSFRSNPVGLEDLVDIDSIVDYYLINEIMLNYDSASKSIYMHKTKDGLMEFGPIWDFDLALSTEYNAPFSKSYSDETGNLYLAKNSIIYNYLFRSNILYNGKTFYDKVAERFDVKKQAIIDTCNHLKNYKQTIDSVANIDARMWHGLSGEFQYDMQYDYVRLFLMDRYSCLDKIFNLNYEEFVGLIE